VIFPQTEVNKINDLFHFAEDAEDLRKLKPLLYKAYSTVSASPQNFLKFFGKLKM